MSKYKIPIPTVTFINATGIVDFRDATVSINYAGKIVNISLAGDYTKDLTEINSKIKALQKMVSPWNIPIPAMKHLEKAINKYATNRDPLASIRQYLKSIKNNGIISEEQYLEALKNLGGEK